MGGWNSVSCYRFSELRLLQLLMAVVIAAVNSTPAASAARSFHDHRLWCFASHRSLSNPTAIVLPAATASAGQWDKTLDAPT